MNTKVFVISFPKAKPAAESLYFSNFPIKTDVLKQVRQRQDLSVLIERSSWPFHRTGRRIISDGKIMIDIAELVDNNKMEVQPVAAS